MQIRFSLASLTAAVLIAVACSDSTEEQSPGEVLARDSSLASELKQADTSAFAEAADVAMAFDPDSAMGPVTSASRTIPSGRSAPTPPTSEPASTVPMRIDRGTTSPSPAGSPDASAPRASRPPMRPAPATIHPDPLPKNTLPDKPGHPVTATRTAPSGTAAPKRAATGSAAAAPAATEILERVPGASLPPAGSEGPCASPASADQRRCLMLHLARSDESLDHTYQALISAMKREAGTPAGAKEPESVQQLRVAQRAWLVYRDTECRRRNRGKEGPLWAPMRAQCLGEFSGTRQEELAKALREHR
jgi:uncharacterized protein YecT (DUF1311 family)